MLLRRLGSKRKLADKIMKYFPEHRTYIEPFFGAGGMFFSKTKAKYNLLNDVDAEVINLFNVIQSNYEAFIEKFEIMPLSTYLYCFLKNNIPDDPVARAARFVYLSNFGLYGVQNILRIGLENSKAITLRYANFTREFLKDTSLTFTNYDFRKALQSISFRKEREEKLAFVYADPPYLGCAHTYSQGFTEQDSLDLFDALAERKWKWAMSEFDNPFIKNLAKERGCHVHTIGERQTLKRRNVEILITNYAIENNLF